MNFLNAIKEKGGEFVSENSTALLTAGGVVGTVATSLLAGRAGFKLGTTKIEKKIDKLADQLQEKDPEKNPYLRLDEIDIDNKDIIVPAIPQLIPPLLTGSATIFAIIMSHRMSAQKAAALAAAYGLMDKQFGEYKSKVEERLTGQKQTAIKDEMAQNAVDRTPGADKIVIVEGEVLCFDAPSGRYFNSTVERIRQAANTTNAEVLRRGFAPASFFYDELDLPKTDWSGEVGFGPENPLELDISATVVGGNRPCIVVNFSHPPRAEYSDPKSY